MNISAPVNSRVKLLKEGSSNYTKTSYPIRYGRYSQIESNGFRFQFNLNGEIRHVAGTGKDWPHPAEWLKRTQGNDWVYYSTGDYYSGVIDVFGEYYFPYPAYPTNSIFKENPFSRNSVIEALGAVEEVAVRAGKNDLLPEPSLNDALRDFQNRVSGNTAEKLQKRAEQLHRILKAQVSVLPPDCRHVDYDVIPVMVTDGCLYNCSFCEVKSGVELERRPRDEIVSQLTGLKEFYGPDLKNYNSIYLGQHDTLAAEPDDLLFAIMTAYELLGIGQSYMNGPKLFLFGSAESFLGMNEKFWARLNMLPFYTYVNIGLESFDDRTLDFLKKPVSSAETLRAFRRMLAVNKTYEHIEITANFVLGGELPVGHVPNLLKHVGEGLGKHLPKGCLYFSPLKGSRNTREILERFREIKLRSRVDTFLYLIQRL